MCITQITKIVPLLIGILLVTVSKDYAQGKAKQKAVVHDTVTSLVNQKKQIVVLKVSEKKFYKMQRTPASLIHYSENESPNAGTHGRLALVATASHFYTGAIDCTGDEFAGKDRAIAKTHLLTTPAKEFATVDALFSSGLLIADNTMKNHNPAVTTNPQSPRVQEENVNVIIDKAFIYGIYREKDNDFHIILGNGKTGTAMKLINIEVAGLPDQGNELKNARDEIVRRFGDITCNDGAFKPVGTLIPVKVSGSLFYDIDHAPGIVGFGTFKPKKSWEIHPVKDIAFLDGQ